MEALSSVEKYRLLRSRLEFEYSLMNQRVTWLVMSQSFLYSAYAVSLNFGSLNDLSARGKQNLLLLNLLPLMGIVLAAVVYLTIFASLMAIAEVTRHARKLHADLDTEAGVGFRSRPSIYWMGLTVSVVVPAVFAVVWAWLWIGSMRM